MAYDTASNLINRAAKQLGLGSVSSPYGSTDPNFVQLCEFLTTAGEDLLRRSTWPHLVKDFSWVTTASQTTQALPTDFQRMSFETFWDQSNEYPSNGPVSGREAAYLVATGSTMNTPIEYRVQGSNLTFPVALGADLTVSFEYLSNLWVMADGSSVGDKSAPTLDNDVCMFDPILLVRALKVLWLSAKGEDTQAAIYEYETTLRQAKGDGTGSRRLSLSGPRRGTRFLSGLNVPDTGYGT